MGQSTQSPAEVTLLSGMLFNGMYFPAAQVAGDELPAAQKLPDGQSIGKDDPDGQYSPP